MALIRSTLLLFRTHFTRVLLTRRTLLCALIALGPAALAVLVLTSEGQPPTPIEVVVYPGWFLLQIVVPATSLIMGSAVISEEIDDRTITYLLTRPFPRPALLLGRWLATALLLAMVLGSSALLLGYSAATFAPAGTDPIPHAVTTWPLARMAILGGAVYSALFAVIGVFLKRPMIIGLAYAFVIEGVLASLPGKSQGLAVVYHLRSYVASQSPHWQELSQELLFKLEPPATSVAWLVTTMVVALALGSVLISRRQYVLTA